MTATSGLNTCNTYATMGLLGSLFKKQKQKTSEQETNIRSSENVISEKVIDTPLGKGVIREERYPVNPMISDEGMPLAYQMATDICWKHNTHQDVPVVWDALNRLYTYVQKNSGMTLINLPAEQSGHVGHAFTIYALCYGASNGDRDYNSVSAENAYYCLYKEFLKNQSKQCACMLFALLSGPKDLMMDKCISARMEEYERAGAGMALRLRCMGRNPFSDPMLEDFREEAHSFSLAAARYLLDFFYDVNTRSFKCAADFLYFVPSERHLDEFFDEYSQYNFTDRTGGQHDSTSVAEDGYKVVGKAWAGYLFDQCEETLMKY